MAEWPRIAALYDIHGNLPALEAVLLDVERTGADLIVVGGDVVPGPMPAECLACLRELSLPTRFLLGNGERDVLAARSGRPFERVPEAFRGVIQWSADQLDGDAVRAMEGWPATVVAESTSLGRILFCHATPRDDNEIFTRLTPDGRLRRLLGDVGADVLVCGHTHMQFARQMGRASVVNAGSVGMPFGEPGAYWLMIGPRLELRHTRYDLDAAADRIRATQYPGAEDFAERSVRRPPTEDAMLQAFSRTDMA